MVNVYPNPADDKFTLDYNFNTNTQIQFAIFNVIGEIVYDKDIVNTKGKLTIDAKLMQPGIYFIQLIGKDRRENIKLIIAR